jgi:hypothetical protein
MLVTLHTLKKRNVYVYNVQREKKLKLGISSSEFMYKHALVQCHKKAIQNYNWNSENK